MLKIWFYRKCDPMLNAGENKLSIKHYRLYDVSVAFKSKVKGNEYEMGTKNYLKIVAITFKSLKERNIKDFFAFNFNGVIPYFV